MSLALPSQFTKFSLLCHEFDELLTKIQSEMKLPMIGTQTLNCNTRAILSQISVVRFNLHAFLESKRDDYPRFYYLSNDDLLTILYETDMSELGKILAKCFNFEEMKFLVVNNDKKNLVKGVIVDGSEHFDFTDCPIEIPESKQFSSVEKWLSELDKKMKDNLKEHVFQNKLKNCQAEQILISLRFGKNSSNFNYEKELENCKFNENLPLIMYYRDIQQSNDQFWNYSCFKYQTLNSNIYLSMLYVNLQYKFEIRCAKSKNLNK